MANLKTTYMGFELRNPIIVGSSGLTNSVENVIEVEKNGAGAVVLKSLFEEQILQEASKAISAGVHTNSYPEAFDYISNYSKESAVGNYLDLIRNCKKAVKIPVIASINCVSSSEWMEFAARIQEAGADGLELNIFILPSDPRQSGEENEQAYLNIVMNIQKVVTIPIAVKLSYYFSGLAKTALTLSWTGISAMVLFNRFFSPDIDINTFEVKPSHVFSTPEELSISLRWVAMLSSRLHCDIAASTGVHNGEAVIKQLLAGAKAVQVCSVLYKNGFGEIKTMLSVMESWMDKHGFKSIADFNGRMSIKETDNPAAYERVQFMKYFSGIE
ncbi:MAG: dihydroorotate dehydrogenase-like protein [Bacteroidetes bacterium]|nr:dihydroorotate dehydrogenase-like protein [Bacteroidota bacterium]